MGGAKRFPLVARIPSGRRIKWTYIEKKKEGGITHATGKSRPDTVPVPERLQQDTLSA
jgi:hypothetical protein